ncbi:MAG: YczE/YyaS/YitT family protein [Streptomycetales bacterium]
MTETPTAFPHPAFLPRTRRVRRLAQLYAGLACFGVSMALMIRSNLGLNPWDTFHQGVAGRTGLSFGTVTIVVGAAVLVLWIPLRQRLGLGTVSNVVVIGLAVDATLAVLDAPDPLPVRVAFLAGGIVLNGVATGSYIGAGTGAGPRDGLMTGLVARTGWSVRAVRTAIEVTVLATGWLLGGTVGVGTVAYALAIGPLVHVLLPPLTVREPDGAGAGG